MPQKRRHKSPFVVTIASVATVSLGVVACGGSTADDLHGTGGTGAQGGAGGSSGSGGASGSSGTGNGGTSAGCPSAFPTNGAPCSLPSGTTCSFDQGACCPDWQAQCIDGVWSAFASSCNPPPPAPCPEAPPKDGEACGSSDPCGNSYQYCTYGLCADGSPATIAECTGSVWSVKYANCAPPPCEALDACSCFARSDCKPLSDGCLCYCDYSCPGEPPCDCACGGGTYLGCASAASTGG